MAEETGTQLARVIGSTRIISQPARQPLRRSTRRHRTPGTPELLEEGLALHWVAEIYVMGAPVLNCAVDITSTIDRKIEAPRAHRSQLGDRLAELERMIRTMAAERGVKHGMELR